MGGAEESLKVVSLAVLGCVKAEDTLALGGASVALVRCGIVDRELLGRACTLELIGGAYVLLGGA